MPEIQEKVRGGCFCGRIGFEIDREFIMYRYCFCSRCRKIRGTAHAANIFIRPQHLHWLCGEDEVSRYDLEGARFGNSFCRHCGSPAPRLTTDGKAYLVTAGTLDSDPGIVPGAAIFWDSRVPWLPEPDGIEKHSEY